jgi:hypothetical protein
MSHLILGAGLIVLGLCGMSMWWSSFGLVMRGLVPFGLLGFGIIAILSSYNRLSARARLISAGEED